MDKAGIAVLQQVVANQNRQSLNEDSIVSTKSEPKAYTGASDMINEHNMSMYAQRKFIDNSKKAIGESFMSLAIGTVFDQVMNEQQADVEDYLIGHKMINTFVKEEGYENLIRRFAHKNITLSEMARYCEIYRDAITEGVIDTIKQKYNQFDKKVGDIDNKLAANSVSYKNNINRPGGDYRLGRRIVDSVKKNAALAKNEVNFRAKQLANKASSLGNNSVQNKVNAIQNRAEYTANKIRINNTPMIKEKLSIVRNKLNESNTHTSTPYGENALEIYNYFRKKEDGELPVRENTNYAVATDYTISLNEDEQSLKNMDTCYKLDKAIADDFIEDIKDLIPGRAIDIIQDRVSDSMQDFIDRNNDNKAAIMDIYGKASERINGTEDGPVKDDLVNLSKTQVNEVYTRPTTVLNAIVKSIAESVVKKDELKKSYMTEDGHIDMDKVVNSGLVMYTVLECLNTMEMVDFTSDYLKKTLKSIS